jgi:hypothetical protein
VRSGVLNLLLLLLFRSLLGLVPPDGAARRGAQDTMVSGNVARDATDNGALGATLRAGWRRQSDQDNEQGDERKLSSHVFSFDNQVLAQS